MPITLDDLLREPALGLRVHTDSDGLDRTIHWVHSTELVDPTTFLEGGELLLTTGLSLLRDEYRDYAGRLAEAGVAGLGFGTGLGHDEVPDELVAAADAVGLPVLEVPHETPFIALSKAVSRALAADEYAAVAHTSAAQQELTRAAVGGRGFRPLLRRLARLVDAWVVLLNRSGEVMQAEPPSAASHAARLRADVDRLGSKGGPTSGRFTRDGADVWMQALGTPGRGFLAVGSTRALNSTDQHVVNTAVSLLTLSRKQSRQLHLARRHLRARLFTLLTAGQIDLVRESARDVGRPLPEPPLQVVALAGSRPARDSATDVLEAEADRLEEPVFFAEVERAAVALVTSGGSTARWLGELPQRIEGLRAGVSDEIDGDAVGEGHRQAMQAVEHAQRTQGSLAHFRDIAGAGLFSMVPPDQARAFADSLLAPLRDNTKLVESLREWLRQHGQWDPAAARLTVHRHTLRNRMRKVEELTGRSLDSPGFRAELWFAMQYTGAGEHPNGPR